MIKPIKIYLMASFMLLLSSLWAGGAAMASYCAAMSVQSQQMTLCGTGANTSKSVSYADLGLSEPDSQLPSAEQCDCELSQVQAGPIDNPSFILTPMRYAQIDSPSLTPDTHILRIIRAAYLSRGPPLRA